MNHEKEDSNHPEIHHIREKNQEHWESMMQSVFIKVAFRSDKNVLEESSKMFSKLYSIINFHCVCGLVKWINIFNAISAVPVTTKPGWHIACWQQNYVSKYRCRNVVKYTKCPFNNGITSFFSCLRIRILCVTDIIFLT